MGQIIQNARDFNPRHWVEAAMNPDSLLQATKALFTLLAEREISYVLVGGIALLHYVEGRNTEDIDLIMALPDLSRLPEIEIQQQDMYFARGLFQGLQIDVLLTENPLFQLVQAQHTNTQRLLDQKVTIATVEGLLLLKMYALPSLYRQGSFVRVGIYENDLAALLFAFRPKLPPLFNTLSIHLSQSDLTALQAIISEIGQRIKRFERIH